MKQWEVYSYDFAAPIGEHPVVVISNKEICDTRTAVNVLKCVTFRADMKLKAAQVILNGADGLDHKRTPEHLPPAATLSTQESKLPRLIRVLMNPSVALPAGRQKG